MKRAIRALLSFLLLQPGLLFAQDALKALVTGTMQVGSGAAATHSFARFQLTYCGSNQARVVGTSAVVGTPLDVQTDSNGVYSTPLYGNDVISCGSSVGGSRWRVTQFVNGVSGPSYTYNIQSGTVFNLDGATQCAGGGAVLRGILDHSQRSSGIVTQYVLGALPSPSLITVGTSLHIATVTDASFNGGPFVVTALASTTISGQPAYLVTYSQPGADSSTAAASGGILTTVTPATNCVSDLVPVAPPPPPIMGPPGPVGPAGQPGPAGTAGPSCDVSTMIGVDLGAKINACDALLGANPGEIWVTISGTLTTQVSISSGHTLRLHPGAIVTEPAAGGPILIPYTSQNAGIICDSPSATIIDNQTSYTGANFGGEAIKIGSNDSAGPFNKDASTTLSVAGVPSATSITVASNSGFVAGQDILLKEQFSGPYKYSEFNIVASVAGGTTINLVYPLESAYRITGAGTGVFAWNPGHLTKNWFVKGCHVTSTTGIAANTSGPGIAAYTAIKGTIRDNVVDSMGGRGIVAGASGFPAGYVTADANYVENVGQNTVIGSPSIEAYSQSVHTTFTNNIVRGGTSHCYATHGLYKVLTGNQAHGCGNVPGSTAHANAAGFAHDSGEDIILSNNIADSCTGIGFLIFGSSILDSTESTRMVITGNIAKDNGDDGFSLGTAGSAAFVRANVEGNFAYRNLGANGGFAFWSANPQVAFNIVGNWSEGNTNYGYTFGNIHSAGNVANNISIGNGNGFNFNSASSMNIEGNVSNNDTTNAWVFGSSDALKLIGNTQIGGGGGVTGTVGAQSYVVANRFAAINSQFPALTDNFNFNGNNITGINFTAGPEITIPFLPAAGTQEGYFKAGSGYCALDSTGVERCTSGSGTVAPATQFKMGYYTQPGTSTSIGGDVCTTDGGGNQKCSTLQTTSVAQPGIVDFTANGSQDSQPVATNTVGIEAPAGPITVPYRLQLSETEPPNTNQLLQIIASPASHRWKIGYRPVTYVDVSQAFGATADAKITNAANSCTSTSGCFLEACSLNGAQTFVADPLPNGHQYTLHLCNATYSYDPTTMAFTLPSNTHLLLDNATIISSRTDGAGSGTPNIIVGMVSARAYRGITGSITTGTKTLTVSDASNATVGAVVAVVGAWGGMNGTNGWGTQSTTINQGGGMGATDTSVTVTSTSGFNAGSDIYGPFLLIGSEIIGYTGSTGTTFTGLTRGLFGTTAATHANAGTILQVGSMVSQITGISGNVLTLNDNASFTVANANVVIGATHVVIDGVGTLDGNYTNRAVAQSSPVYAAAFPFTSLSFIGPNIKMQNVALHTLFLLQAERNEIHGIFRFGGRPAAGLGADVILGGSNYNKISTNSHENGNFMVVLDDRSSASGIFDGPSSNNEVIVGPQVGNTQYSEAIGIEGSSNNSIFSGAVSCSTTQTNGCVYITSSGQWATDPQVVGNKIYTSSVNETGGGGVISVLLNSVGNVIESGKISGNGLIQIAANNQATYYDSTNTLTFAGFIRAINLNRSAGNIAFPDLAGDGTHQLVVGDSNGVSLASNANFRLPGGQIVGAADGTGALAYSWQMKRSAGVQATPDITGDGTHQLVLGDSHGLALGTGIGITGTEISTPSPPSAGIEFGYYKAGSGWCALDSSSVERCTGSGGGGSLSVNNSALTCTGGGTAQAQTATCSPAMTTLTTGNFFSYTPTNANTATAPAIVVSGLASKTITKCGTVALVPGDLATVSSTLQYDGTEWVLQNPQVVGCAAPEIQTNNGAFVGPAGTTALAGPAANGTKMWVIFPPNSITSTKIGYHITTIDNSGSLYDLGIYDRSGTLVCHLGATPGTTFAAAAGAKSLSWASTCTIVGGSRYYVAMTGNAAVAQLGGAALETPGCGVSPTANGTTTGGVLNSSGVTAPADNYVSCSVPQILIY